MKKTYLFLVVSMFLGWSVAARAQVPELIHNKQFRTDARAAVDSLYNFNPKGAEQLLAPWKKEYPNHPLWPLLNGMTYWWTVLSDLNDTSHDKQFFRMMEQADYAASKLLHNQPGHADALIIKTVANGYVARLHSDRDDWLASLSAARKAYKAYGVLQEREPELADLKFAEGLKLYYSAYLPEAYPIVKTISWFLPDGDKEQGLADLRDAAKTAVFARAEAAYFLGNINYNYEHHYEKALGYFQQLYKAYPHSNYYVRLLVKNYFKTGRYNDALHVIDEALDRWQTQGLPFGDVLREELYFWKGRILLRRSQLKKAAVSLKKSYMEGSTLPRPKYRSFHTASAYYLGETLYQTGEKQEAAFYYHAVLDSKNGDDFKDLAKKRLNAIQ